MPLLVGATLLLFVAANAGLACQQWLLGLAVHDVTQGKAVLRLADGTLDHAPALRWLAVLGAVALARALLAYAVTLASQQCNQRLLTLLRARIFNQVQQLPLAYHWRHGMGELVSLTTRDADKVRDAMITFWRQGVDTVLVLVAVPGLLSWYHPALGLVPLLLSAVALALLLHQAGHLVVLDRATGAAYDRVNQDISEGVTGVRVIKSFVLERQRSERFAREVALFAAQSRAALVYASSRVPLPQTVVAMGHVWIMLYGAQLVARGQLDLGQLTAALLLATMLVFRLEGVGSAMQAWSDARSSAGRIWDLLDTPLSLGGGAGVLPPGPLGCRLTQVTLGAPGGGKQILDDCTLTLAPGEVVALVGPTGAGKSMLAHLLPRLLKPDSGTVELGAGADGWQDAASLDLAALRRRVHVVPQESFLFSDTVAANLRLAAPHASDADLQRALRLASAGDIVAGLEHGQETQLGERGATLSGGQRQRLCLARALLAAPDLLVLDDATSALDAVTERRVLEALRSDAAGRPTLLLIASKLSTVLHADRVLLLDGGRIAATGTHAQLARGYRAYRELLGMDEEVAHG
ncbi:ATP-binding cassette domain-containing protein [Pseudoduganella sp. FT26W]|uniref:Cyclolysin secretion/processing ATP-binding protein CyaB n=2 Tax=Duganella aquatilis TaxID=2666082 RepID=A0A844DDX9_9BURK|nr:ABC transporter ATP-binding protein [Duganella aquatilis]MRW87472.1 ATP-binding cassette domain-containing protein [Duganella aquatilis]